MPHHLPRTQFDEGHKISSEASGHVLEDRVQQITIVPQGKMGLGDYLRYGSVNVPKYAVTQQEQASKSFVRGLNNKRHRAKLWALLDETGWTWENVETEVGTLVSSSQAKGRSAPVARATSEKRKNKKRSQVRRGLRRDRGDA